MNALQTQFNATTGSFTLTTRLVGPLGFLKAASEQGGLVFGPDQDNYIKLVAVAQPNGQFLQFVDEQKAAARRLTPTKSVRRARTRASAASRTSTRST